MKIKIKKYLTVSLFLFGINFQTAFALRPVESLVLGNFSEQYSENATDPLEFVFGRDLNIKSENLADYKKDLALYRGFYEEGKNLTNSCKEQNTIRYASEWDKQQVIRTVMSEIQYIGLDLMARAIPKYAKYFEFKDEEYQNLVDDLVGNYCSNNLSVISKKELKNNLLLKFSKDNTFVLPTVKGNPLFPDNLDKYMPERKAREQEFKATIRLFQSVCSWGGDPFNPVLMSPLLKNPALMAFINRQLNFKGLDWNPKKNTLGLIDSNKTVQVSCDNLICRRTNYPTFKSKIPLSVGAQEFYQDFKNLYCDFFQISDYQTKGLDPKFVKRINEITLDEENFMTGQFMALITGYPDFLLGLEKYKDGEDLFRSSMDYSWSNWALNQTTNFTRELYFEEPLTLELIDQDLYFKARDGKLKVAFDVNLGEFDRINQMVGKLKVGFKLTVTKSFLRYVKNTVDRLEFSDGEEKRVLLNRFKAQIERDVNLSREKLIIPPWKGDLSLLIADVLTEQIHRLDKKFFSESDSGMSEIPVEIYYSPFALKYLNHQFNIKTKENNSKL